MSRWVIYRPETGEIAHAVECADVGPTLKLFPGCLALASTEGVPGSHRVDGGAVVALPPPVPTAAELAAAARARRDRELAASDWTQLPDAPVDRAAWAAYRAALRDLPAAPGWPEAVDWPERPA